MSKTTIGVKSETRARLALYKVENKFESIDQVINHLLDNEN